MKFPKADLLFPVTVFWGAFLLFQIQPIVGKHLLPWFGGAPAVWLTCLMFFQIFLLGGYTYAHGLQQMKPKRQTSLHGLLLLVALAAGIAFYFVWGSPILPSASWGATRSSRPVFDIVRLLAAGIGIAYLLLAASAPLLQAWFHGIRPQRSPYVFYIVSNAASLAALLSYPLLFEPLFTVHQQAWIWCAGFASYAILCIGCIGWIRKASANKPRGESPHLGHAPVNAYSFRQTTLWTALSFCGVLALMSATNRMTQDIPPVPFLWILPLSIYLLSYIIGFADRLRNGQELYIIALACAFIVAWHLAREGLETDIRAYIACGAFILFAVCLFCHNALYRIKPDPKHLTGFYLCISLGGAGAGAFAVLAAPLLFKGYWEYEMMLLLSGGLAVYFVYTDLQTRKTFRPILHALPVLLLGFGVLLVRNIHKDISDAVFMDRNFFGAIRVKHELNNNIPIYTLLHGQINHGNQIHHPLYRHRPTTYFTENSGVGITTKTLQASMEKMKIGVLGMGIGTLAVYGREGDSFRMYEIDPVVIDLAMNTPWFTYLKDSEAAIEIIVGDGRLSLELELSDAVGNNFDLLVLDAFSGDSPPAHLLTLEAFDLYLRHLGENGVIAVNISNRYLDLLPVLDQVKARMNLHAANIRSKGDYRVSASANWVLLTRDPGFINQPDISRVDVLPRTTVKTIRPWTDDFSNLFDVLK